MKGNPLSPVRFLKPKDDSDIQGSPLKDDCDVKGLSSPVTGLQIFNPWEEVSGFGGIDIEKARSLLNKLTEDKVMQHDKGSVWVLCDAHDFEQTLLLQLEATPDWRTRGIVVSRGRSHLITVHELLKRHQRMIKNASEPGIAVNTFYSFNNYTTLKISDAGPQSINFFQDSTITLYQTFNIQEHKSVALDFFGQICLLNNIFGIIVKYRDEFDEDSDDPEYCGVADVTLDFIVQQVRTIFLSIPEATAAPQVDTEYVQSLLERTVKQAKGRQLTSTTDQVWDVLKLCGSFKDLKAALQSIFVLAAKSNIVNLPPTTTKLGELIHDIAKQRIAIPHLTGTQPLELLLEIGIEKITRDFEFIFTEAQVCSASELKVRIRHEPQSQETAMNVRKSLHNIANAKSKGGNDGGGAEEPKRKTLMQLSTANEEESESSVVGFQNSRFNQDTCDNQISRLLQIQLILEHLLLLHTNLGLDSLYAAVAERLLHTAPEKLKKVLKRTAHKIKVDVVDDKVRDLIYAKRPTAQRIAIKSSNNFRKIETVHYFSEDPLVPPTLYPHVFTSPELQTTVEDVEDDLYWLATYTKISSRMK